MAICHVINYRPFIILLYVIHICQIYPVITWFISATSTNTITTNRITMEMGVHTRMRWQPILISHGLITLKLSKVHPLKLLLWKVTISTDHVIFDCRISWQMKKACGNFYKCSQTANLIGKKQNILFLFFRFKIYMTNARSWNKLKLLLG